MLKLLVTTFILAGLQALQPVTPDTTVRLVPVTGEGAAFWTRWRGPSGQGLATPGKYVDTWSATTNVLWKAPVPGLGHSSPIVWRDHIFLTTAEDGGRKLSMIAFRRGDGARLWQTVVPSTSVEPVYPKNSHASATAVTDGRLV